MRRGPLTTARVLAVAVQLGDVACLLTVLAAVFSELTTFGNHTVARRMGALIGLHDFLLSFYLPRRLGHWPEGVKSVRLSRRTRKLSLPVDAHMAGDLHLRIT